MNPVHEYLLAASMFLVGGIFFFGGWKLSKTRAFPVLLTISFLALGLYVLVNRMPSLFSWLPVRLLFAGQRDHLHFLAMLIPFLLGLLAPRLPEKRNRVALGCLAGMYLFFPASGYFLTAWDAEKHRGLNTFITGEGVCIQRTSYTCGPAAGVTALRVLGIDATESELTLASGCNSVHGTGPVALGGAIRDLYGVDYQLAVADSLDTYEDKLPLLVDISLSPMLDHWVVILEAYPDRVVLGDPLQGKRVMTRDEFMEVWNHRILYLIPPKTKESS